MQISYHSVLTKIQKLQNLKKKKNFFLHRPVLLKIGQYGQYEASTPVFFLVRNRGVERTGLLAGTVYSGRTGRYGTESITLLISPKAIRRVKKRSLNLGCCEIHAKQ